MRFTRSFVLATGLALAVVAPAEGQIRIAVSAFGGGIVPTGDVPVPRPALLDLSQDAGPVFGGRLAVMFARFGLEAEAGYALSGVDEFVAREEDLPFDVGLFLSSLNVVFLLYRAPFSPLSIHASAGGGIVNRGGDYFEPFSGTTDIAGAVGIGFRFGLSPLASVRFDLRDYFSSFKPTARTDIEKESKIQNDLIATVGLELSFAPTP